MTGELDNERALRLLQSIDHRLALLAASSERALRQTLASEVLRTASRTALWEAIDGERGSPELAKTAGVSERSAQLFVNELLELALVQKVGREFGRGTVVVKDDARLVEWYLSREEESGEGERRDRPR